jgi:hypothetical protein
MAKIKTYAKNTAVKGEDILIGSKINQNSDTKNHSVDDLAAYILGSSSGFVGSLAIADIPTEGGVYIASESGTYINAGQGDLVTDLSRFLTYIAITDDLLTAVKIEIALPSTGYRLVPDLTTFNALITENTEGESWLIVGDITITSNKSLPANTTLVSRGGVIDGAFTLTGDDSIVGSKESAIFGTSLNIAGAWSSDFTPYMFGAKGSTSATDDTVAIQRCVNVCATLGIKMVMVGSFLANTITFPSGGEIDLYTKCSVQTLSDVDGIIFDGCFVKHTGTFSHRGIEVSRETGTRNIVMTGVFPAGGKFSKFDTFFLSQASIGIDYEAAGNNNGITWNYVQCREHSRTGRSAYTKGAQVSNSNIFNIGIITTPAAIETRMGHIIIQRKAYPIVPHPTLALTYYVGDFYNMPDYSVGVADEYGSDSNLLWHYTGGGIIHQRWADNGAVDYKTINMVSLDGASITVQSQYGITVNGGEIEGNATSVVVGGIGINVSDGVTPESILHIRSMFIGLHTEVNVAQEPLVYTLAKSNVTFGGSLMADGVRVSGAEGGVRFHSWRGSDRLSNVYFAGIQDADVFIIRPINPDFVVYRDMTSAPSLQIDLADLAPDMEYMGDARIDYVVRGEVNLLNIPVGVTKTLVINGGGSEVVNTINGGASDSISIIGTANRSINKITFLMKGVDFKTFVDEDGVKTPLVVEESLTVNGPVVINEPRVAGEAQRFNTTAALGSLYTTWKKTGDVLKGFFGFAEEISDDLFFVNNENAKVRFGTNGRLNDFVILEDGTVHMKEFLIADLPAAGTLGRMAYVTDALTPTYLGTLTAGGAVKCPVFDNGTAWVSH